MRRRERRRQRARYREREPRGAARRRTERRCHLSSPATPREPIRQPRTPSLPRPLLRSAASRDGGSLLATATISLATLLTTYYTVSLSLHRPAKQNQKNKTKQLPVWQPRESTQLSRPAPLRATRYALAVSSRSRSSAEDRVSPSRDPVPSASEQLPRPLLSPTTPAYDVDVPAKTIEPPVLPWQRSYRRNFLASVRRAQQTKKRTLPSVHFPNVSELRCKKRERRKRRE